MEAYKLASTVKRIGVLTGGGDAPGLNAVLRAVVKTAINIYGWSVVGIEDGFEGLLGETRMRPLIADDVRGLLPRGGTILGSTNRGNFARRRVEGGEAAEGVYQEAMRNFERAGLDGVIVIGGEGSQTIAYEFFKLGMPVVGVPKTIDNDLMGTELTFGFDTALDIATEAIDRLHTTAESHDRVMLVEVMGRHTGWIALQSGVAGGADVILIPEIPFHVEKIVEKVRARESQGRYFSIIVVAEGATPAGGMPRYQDADATNRVARLGGIAYYVAETLAPLLNKECRVVVLGHLQRGGTPTAFDRSLASCYGSAAVRAIARGMFGHMVAWTGSEIVTVPLERCVSSLKTVPTSHYLVGVARDLSISFAGEED
jgi:phosphofructokinase-like protein